MPTLADLSRYSRQTPEAELTAYNATWRRSPVYQQYMREIGNDGSGRVRLSRGQQAELERRTRAAGIQIPGAYQIDQGGNWNTKNRLGKALAIGGAATLAAVGIPGVFPGVFTAGGGPAGAGAGAAGGTGAGASSGALSLGAVEGGAFGLPAASVASLPVFGGGGLMKIGKVPWGTIAGVGADVGVGLLNSWLESGAINKSTEAGLEESRQTRAQQQRQFEANLALERERFGAQTDQFAQNLALERDQYGLQRQNWEQTEANRAPYRSLGVGGLQRLSRGVGAPMGPVERVPAPSPALITRAVASGAAPGAPTSAGIANAPGTGAMVLLRAPTGAERAVPEADVDHYLREGAVRVAV